MVIDKNVDDDYELQPRPLRSSFYSYLLALSLTALLRIVLVLLLYACISLFITQLEATISSMESFQKISPYLREASSGRLYLLLLMVFYLMFEFLEFYLKFMEARLVVRKAE